MFGLQVLLFNILLTELIASQVHWSTTSLMLVGIQSCGVSRRSHGAQAGTFCISGLRSTGVLWRSILRLTAATPRGTIGQSSSSAAAYNTAAALIVGGTTGVRRTSYQRDPGWAPALT